ncbi:unnamed protein product [Musa hybrid cultivar]
MKGDLAHEAPVNAGFEEDQHTQHYPQNQGSHPPLCDSEHDCLLQIGGYSQAIDTDTKNIKSWQWNLSSPCTGLRSIGRSRFSLKMVRNIIPYNFPATNLTHSFETSLDLTVANNGSFVLWTMGIDMIVKSGQ